MANADIASLCGIMIELTVQLWGDCRPRGHHNAGYFSLLLCINLCFIVVCLILPCMPFILHCLCCDCRLVWIGRSVFFNAFLPHLVRKNYVGAFGFGVGVRIIGRHYCIKHCARFFVQQKHAWLSNRLGAANSYLWTICCGLVCIFFFALLLLYPQFLRQMKPLGKQFNLV